MSEAAHAINLLGQRFKNNEPVSFIHAIVPDDDEAIHWVRRWEGADSAQGRKMEYPKIHVTA